MDLQGLGAFLSALGGIFTAKAGAQAGQLQGLLMGEDLTERRKRMQMAEEAHQLQTELLRAEEARKQQMFPFQIGLLEQDLKRRQTLLPYEEQLLSTQVERGKLDLLNTRLWSMYQRGVVPSQISDPVLRAEYEPFFNFQSTANSLQWVRSQEELDKLLANVSEEWRPTLEILGRASLLRNQMQEQIWERHLRGADLNLAQGEFQFRIMKLNNALTLILNNINNEGLDWDKRTPQQKIEAVKKWIAQYGLEDIVPEDFANMFQRIKSVDARQLALYRAQSEINYGFQSRLLGQQIAGNITLQDRMMWGNLVFGALQGQGGGGLAPVGFPALPAINIFKGVFDNNQTNLNEIGLRDYLKYPADIPVPLGGGTEMLSALATRASTIYRNLARPNAQISVNDINTLIAYDAGLIMAKFAENNMQIDWKTAFAMAKSRVIPALKGNRAYQTQPIHYAQVIDNWEQWWVRNIEQGGSAPQNNNLQQPRGTIGGQPRQQIPSQSRSTTGGRIQTDRLDRQP